MYVYRKSKKGCVIQLFGGAIVTLQSSKSELYLFFAEFSDILTGHTKCPASHLDHGFQLNIF